MIDNCLSYGLNRLGGAIFPGGGGGENVAGDCPGLMKQLKSDSKVKAKETDCNGNCPDGTHKIRVYSDPPGFHIQRQDADGSWSELEYHGSGAHRCKPKSHGKKCGDLCVPN